MTFASRSARSHFAEAPRSTEVPCSCLSWDSFRPSAVFRARVHSRNRTQTAEATLVRSIGPTMPLVGSRSVLVVSHHRDGFLRAPGTGLLHPDSGHGVRRVSQLPASLAARKQRWCTVAVLATHSPFEESPSTSAVPRHRGLLPSCRFRSSTTRFRLPCGGPRSPNARKRRYDQIQTTDLRRDLPRTSKDPRVRSAYAPDDPGDEAPIWRRWTPKRPSNRQTPTSSRFKRPYGRDPRVNAPTALGIYSCSTSRDFRSRRTGTRVEPEGPARGDEDESS